MTTRALDSTDAPRLMPDVSPAKWIWFPSTRCLPSTFVLFRREVALSAPVKRATGWISADSRYQLNVNGKRIQWGPAPCDPRFLEADPIDLTDQLQQGNNLLAAQVMWFGHGDGTAPMGKPGFLFTLTIETTDGNTQTIVSDESWQCHLSRAWRAGQYKRSYVRAFQEEFDARQHPYGWDTLAFKPDRLWTSAMLLNCSNDDPPICAHYENHLFGFHGETDMCEMRQRTIPLLKEYPVEVHRLVESYYVKWHRLPEEYFECNSPDPFDVEPDTSTVANGDGSFTVNVKEGRSAVAVFDFKEQVVGWPRFTVDAPEGTIVEMFVHEAHKPLKDGGPPIMNTHWYSWTRLTCKQGVNEFETFDYESVRWIQLLIRGNAGKVKISNVGMRRRIYPWPHQPVVACSEPGLQRLYDASINTLHNCAQDIVVDGMARERQQYSGDCGHQMHAIYMTFGETAQPARFMTTWSQGITVDGYFLDCWPAFDRVARVASRALHLAPWGPLLDHGIGFNFDCWNHYLYTGDKPLIAEIFPRLKRFFGYLSSIQGDDGLLPVDNLGIPMVWIDHQGFRKQHHKKCAFNLYAAAMFKNAYAKICRMLGDDESAKAAELLSATLQQACINQFWSKEHGCFTDNLPWLKEEKKIRLSDRALATSVLHDLCPDNNIDAAIEAMATMPEHVGPSYPANAGWRLWALAKAGRTDVVLDDLRERWATMDSVVLNNTLQEDWHTTPDSGYQWSHCAVVPLYVTFMSIAGIMPTEPGFTKCSIRPQLADLEKLNIVGHTVQGPIHFTTQGKLGGRDVHIELPAGCEGELVTDKREVVDLKLLREDHAHRYYQLPAGKKSIIRMRYS